LLAAVVLASGVANVGSVRAQTVVAGPVRSTRDDLATAVAEASRRFGIPADWILAVMRVESAGDAHAVSRAGAIGLMQIMPATYAELRR
ncbi:transglycosylase SLT domain-containing protein, partial [Clostridium perfringens]